MEKIGSPQIITEHCLMLACSLSLPHSHKFLFFFMRKQSISVIASPKICEKTRYLSQLVRQHHFQPLTLTATLNYCGESFKCLLRCRCQHSCLCMLLIALWCTYAVLATIETNKILALFSFLDPLYLQQCLFFVWYICRSSYSTSLYNRVHLLPRIR